MHEFALADAVIQAALQTAARGGIRRLTRIVVELGELQRIDPQTFEGALRQLSPPDDRRLQGTCFVCETAPARLRCRPCGTEFGLAEAGGPLDERGAEAIHFIPELAHGLLGCPACGSPDFDVLGGRGVLLRAVEGQP